MTRSITYNYKLYAQRLAYIFVIRDNLKINCSKRINNKLFSIIYLFIHPYAITGHQWSCAIIVVGAFVMQKELFTDNVNSRSSHTVIKHASSWQPQVSS